jgi:hypothetical protein
LIKTRDINKVCCRTIDTNREDTGAALHQIAGEFGDVPTVPFPNGDSVPSYASVLPLLRLTLSPELNTTPSKLLKAFVPPPRLISPGVRWPVATGFLNEEIHKLFTFEVRHRSGAAIGCERGCA